MSIRCVKQVETTSALRVQILDSATTDLATLQTMDSLSLPRLVGAILTILIVRRVYLRYQEYQVNTL